MSIVTYVRRICKNKEADYMNLYSAYLVFINEKELTCSADTIYYYKFNLARFFEHLGNYKELECSNLTLQHVNDYILSLKKTNIKNVSVNTYIRSIKIFVNWMYEQGFLAENFSKKIKFLKSDKDNIIPLFEKEVAAIDSLFQGNSETALRDYCIVHLMLDAGLRLHEVVALRICDVMMDKNILSVYGKGGKFRVVLLCPRLKNMLFKYMTYYRAYVPEHPAQDEPLFVQLTSSSYLTDDSVKQLFARLKKRSGISRVYPHLCRHTFATSFIMGGGNLEYLRMLLGHCDYNITRNYLHLANQYSMMGADIYKLDKAFFKTMY